MGDPLAVSADMRVHSVDPQLSFLDDVANRLRVAAGDTLVEKCKEARLAGNTVCTPLTTTAGRMSHIRLLLHVVPPTLVGAPLDDQARLKQTLGASSSRRGSKPPAWPYRFPSTAFS